ncbi:MAG: hypothetical protein ACP5FH_03445 [Terracidiphilus sp.]
MPFAPGSQTETPDSAVRFRTDEEMTAGDRLLAANAEPAIAERAGFAGLEFNQGQWHDRQILCSALPGHLFLQFTRDNGTGDVSLFTASIPRNSDGRVRIIPIVRRGYSLFSPAPINALTISAFNHIRAEERQENEEMEQEDSRHAPGWLATGLCYAALAGAHPRIGPAAESDWRKLPSAPPGRLVISLHGGAIFSFIDVSHPRQPMQWTMTFNGKGKLLRATHKPVHREPERTVERKPSEAKGKQVRAAPPEARAILME